MHELGIMASVLDMTVDLAEKNDVEKVLKVTIEIGEYSGIIPDLARQFFSYLSKGTVAEEAEIELKVVPLQVKCRQCGHEMQVHPGEHCSCEKCGSEALQLTSSGRRWRLEALEVI